MTHTVLMPFNRPKHFQTLREGMEGQNVTWVPLYDSDECHALFNSQDRPQWIKPWRGDLPKEHPWIDMSDGRNTVTVRDASKPKVPTVNPGHWMCDAFLDEMVKLDEGKNPFGTQDSGEYPKFYRPDHFVSFYTDDCFWNWHYWIKLQRHFVKRNKGGNEYSPAVILTSTTTPGGGFVAPAYNKSWPHNACRTFATRFEVLTVRADKLKDVRFGSFWAGDGIVVERLVEENIEQGLVEFAEECVVYFNGLRPEVFGFPASHQR